MPRSRPRESPVLDESDDDLGTPDAAGEAVRRIRRGGGGLDRLDFDDEHVTEGRGASGRRGSARSRRE